MTEDEKAAERVALERVLRGVSEGLSMLPAGSPWVGALRDARSVLIARTNPAPERL